MKIVHAADLHLDSPLVGLERYAGAPAEAIRGATRRAFENLITLCRDEEAALLLIAGDIYDGDWKDYSTGLFFAAALGRLSEAGTRVVIVRGNHDAASQITRHLRLPSHVTELDFEGPETRVFDDLGVAIHGQSFRDRAVREDLASAYPDPTPGAFNIGLLHTSVTGRAGHDEYAPCSLETLTGKGYDYFALGHVHGREVLSERPWVVFPGNLQGRHARETGPKGATLIDVQDGRIRSVEHRTLDVVRWCVCTVSAADAASGDDVVDLVRTALEREVVAADGRTVAARVVVEGATRAHQSVIATPERWEAELRGAATEVLDELWLEKVSFGTSALMDVAALATREDAIGQVARALASLAGDPDGRAALLTELSELRAKLPAEVRDGADAIRLDDPEFLHAALRDVEQILLPALAAIGADE
jgi:DNA repair exonuclease SbcCD nuclease subunit